MDRFIQDNLYDLSSIMFTVVLNYLSLCHLELLLLFEFNIDQLDLFLL